MTVAYVDIQYSSAFFPLMVEEWFVYDNTSCGDAVKL